MASMEKKNYNHIERLIDSCGTYNFTIKNISIEEFEKILKEKQAITLARLTTKTSKPKQIDHHLSLYYWIIDNRAAVFSIPAMLDDNSGYKSTAFHTTDKAVIKALLKMNYCS